jgi:hypothetical protein
MNRPDANEAFGALTEEIQVKGAIALAAVTRNGMVLDLARLGPLRERLRRRQDELVAAIEADPDWAGVVARDRHGRPKRTAKGGSPSLSQARLRERLEAAATAAGPDRLAEVPRTPTGKVSLKAEDWEDLATDCPPLGAWIELCRVNKCLEFVANLAEERIHPRYDPLVRTGRTSCSGPNVQQIPRDGGLREAFVPSPGTLFLIVDYAFIELVTLAAVCLARFGWSKLAEVILAGVDPHAYTAAMFEGMTLEAFLAWKSSPHPEDRRRYASLRQRAKVFNFGIPGGLGPRAIVAYARSTYGVALTIDEAAEFRRRLVEEVYPELALYLADDGMEVLARNLGAGVADCWARFDREGDRSGAVVGGIRNVVRGRKARADGRPYSPYYLDKVWGGLAALNRSPELAGPLAGREGGAGVEARLFRGGVATPTGRVRARVNFTQARNTPFQGLAADGAKLALWALVSAGYRVVAFVHDEFVIELPEDADHAAEARRVEAIVVREMERVTGGVPVTCEYALARRWSKSAKAEFDGEGRLVPWDDDRPRIPPPGPTPAAQPGDEGREGAGSGRDDRAPIDPGVIPGDDNVGAGDIDPLAELGGRLAEAAQKVEDLASGACLAQDDRWEREGCLWGLAEGLPALASSVETLDRLARACDPDELAAECPEAVAGMGAFLADAAELIDAARGAADLAFDDGPDGELAFEVHNGADVLDGALGALREGWGAGFGS